jgi:hypothetical protein
MKLPLWRSVFPHRQGQSFDVLSSKIIKAIVRAKSLKHHGKPWQGSLPKSRISPSRTLGNAVIKNSYIRLRGGQMIPKYFKMSLPSMNHSFNEDTTPIKQSDQAKEWSPLPNHVAMQERKATLAPEPVPKFRKG